MRRCISSSSSSSAAAAAASAAATVAKKKPTKKKSWNDKAKKNADKADVHAGWEFPHKHPIYTGTEILRKGEEYVDTRTDEERAADDAFEADAHRRLWRQESVEFKRIRARAWRRKDAMTALEGVSESLAAAARMDDPEPLPMLRLVSYTPPPPPLNFMHPDNEYLQWVRVNLGDGRKPKGARGDDEDADDT